MNDFITLPAAGRVDLRLGDCVEVLRALPDGFFHTCVTSPPYFGLRDYGHDGQIGLEDTPEAFVDRLVTVFREVRRTLRDDGTLWLNLGDSYAAQRGGTHQPAETLAGGKGGKMADGARVNRDRHDGYNPTRNATAIGLKHKDLIGIPWRVAFALQADGWWLRQDIIWAKPNPMPESVRDRCTKSHEYIFLLTKSPNYYFDADAIKEPAVAADGSARKQQLRARQIAAEKGLTEEHIAAIRSAGCTDTGKARVTQNGTGKNTPEVERLANEAKDALGGYYREFLTNDGMRNKRSVWTVTTKPFKGAHFATYPTDLIEPCILAGSPKDGHVLDPFGGSGTTGLVAADLGRHATLIELNPEYGEIAKARLDHRLKA